MNNPTPEIKKQLSIRKIPASIILIQSGDTLKGAQVVQLRYEATYLNLRAFADQVIK